MRIILALILALCAYLFLPKWALCVIIAYFIMSAR
jgi:hypothetical protein